MARSDSCRLATTRHFIHWGEEDGLVPPSRRQDSKGRKVLWLCCLWTIKVRAWYRQNLKSTHTLDDNQNGAGEARLTR